MFKKMSGMKPLAIIASAFALNACVETGPTETVDIMDLPEARLHDSCIRENSNILMTSQANAVDIGYIVAERCKGTRYRLAKAFAESRKIVHQRTFIETFTAEARDGDIAMVAEMVINSRGY